MTRCAPRVFLVVGYLGYGGTERQVVELVRAAHPDHLECTVVCTATAGAMADEVRQTGARVEVLGFHRPRWPLGALRFLSLLRREQPDAVYAFLFHAYSLAMPLTWLGRRSTVRIAGRRSMPSHDIAGVPGARYLRLLADRCTDLVIANAEAVRSAWEKDNPKLIGRTAVVPNGVLIPPAVEPAARTDDRLHVLCVANFQPYKGHAVLVEAARILAERRRDWRLELIGDGVDREPRERDVRRYGLEDVVTFSGSLPREEIHRRLAAAHLVVLPSLTEGMPNAVLEAMAHGRPVVASAVGAVPELLASGAGLAVPAGRAKALAEAMEAMLDDPEARRTAGAEGRRVMDASYSVQVMRDRTVRLLSERISDRRSPTGGRR